MLFIIGINVCILSQVMQAYQDRLSSNSPNIPRVLGLTATIINGKKVHVAKEVEDMEKRLCAKALTYHRYEEVLK